ncbi:MAG TPA: DUF4260 domain-containing protein [Candidatus Acidoferrum sp.]|nr:DUF4260 domain-containing protein [Candidatus Acidoferrum sp.]
MNPFNPRPLLHLEGAAVFLLSLFAFQWSHVTWLLFLVLFLVPDLSMLAYLAGPRGGAVFYNALHTYLGPVILAAVSFAAQNLIVFAISITWTSHIALDRMLGFGLKYPTRFQDTHLSPQRHSFSRAES